MNIKIIFVIFLFTLSACNSKTKDELYAQGIKQLEASNPGGAVILFKSALEQFVALTGTGGGPLQEKYDKLSGAYERSEARAEAVRTRISEVERVAGALFSEWRSELSQYTDASLRSLSERELADTQARYQTLVEAMRRAAARMQPVLSKFKDQVLFLKHNLNAQVVARLGNTNAQLQSDVSQLIAEMERSIQEADSFIREMKPAEAK